MGFKKGRAARAAQAACDAPVDPLGIRDDGCSCVFYTAANGSEYKIDVAKLEQTNVSKGTQRVVHRMKGTDKRMTLWQYEATRPQRHYCEKLDGSPSRIAYMQYPKWVQFALEDRWKHVEQMQSVSGRQKVAEQASFVAWTRVIDKMSDSTFESIFQTCSNSEQCSLLTDRDEFLSQLEHGQTADVPDMAASISGFVATDLRLQQALFDRLVNSQDLSSGLGYYVGCLLRLGFGALPEHCRKIALTSGSVAALRVLIVEGKVDVCGLDLLDSSSSKRASNKHCRDAVTLLLARGAVLGNGSCRPKNLSKLADDGNVFWCKRILDGMGEVFPEFAILQLERFLGLAPDYELRTRTRS